MQRPKVVPLTPAEVASAIIAAKQASANVWLAQQQFQAVKEYVLHQQRIASEKENQAELLRQKTEAAAAIQRSEANAAAQGVSTSFYAFSYKILQPFICILLALFSSTKTIVGQTDGGPTATNCFS